MIHRYWAFGLCIASDIPIIEFLPLEDTSKPIDVTIQAGEVPTITVGSQNYDNYLIAHIKNVAHFLISGSSVTYQLYPDATLEVMRLFLLGTAFGSLLQQRNLVVLHGNCVSIDGGETCRIYVGDSGAGKSTMATWHYHQGDFILADDVCAIGFDENGKPIVYPAFPQLKLWQSSADLFGIQTETLRRVRPQDDKFAIPISGQYWQTPLPLTHIFELKPSNTSQEPYTGMEKIDILLKNTYRYQFVAKMNLNSPYLKLLMKVGSQVEAFSAVRKTIDLET